MRLSNHQARSSDRIWSRSDADLCRAMTDLGPSSGNFDQRRPINLAREADFALGPARIRPSISEVTANGVSIRLQPRVMQVLVALGRAGGGVVSRDDLVASCWGGLSIADDAMNRCIGRLRRLAEHEAAEAFTIETLARIGYRLVSAQTSAENLPRLRLRDAAPMTVRRPSICVLPFANMSDDPQQEYFSDGISEDIITDLSKVSALSVVARNTAFTYKSKAVDALDVARALNVEFLLEGSVRKAGQRVRISAQLIDGSVGDHLWAERWDRDLTDIFALQDEISEAIIAALKLKLLPEEKRAIERRGPKSVDAYDLYLIARRHLLSGNRGDRRAAEVIVRLCLKATEIDPRYARAWALMAEAQTSLRFANGRPDDGLAAAEQALSLDPSLAEARAVRARHLFRLGRHDEASVEIETALRLDPESFEVNESAGRLCLRERRLGDAIGYFEKAAALMESSIVAPGMLITCYQAVGDEAGVRRSAQKTLARAEKVLAQDQGNGTVMGYAVSALAALGEAARAKEWIDRALLIDPDNMNMRYNFACALSVQLKDTEGALDHLFAFFAKASLGDLTFANIDPDLDPVREDPRYRAMLLAAEARLAAVEKLAPPPAT
jgi:adenylate cyclase